jgi:hypothetical protein
MNGKRVFGFVVLIGGIVLMVLSSYIKTQVEQGKMDIASGQEKVDMGNSLFSLNPVTKELGKGVTSSAQNRINQGRLDVTEYEMIAGWLKVGGIVLIVLGAAVVVFGRSKKK